ncbi:cupin domain-containing protein [Streptomyces tubercidicus]|uniref:cupin domain-containing protein n=1 Tax=Streptomyces tubercidicus TaxID=47759 RepID=UPI002E1195B7|nr:cupin domain-containing protein [Streptomyces tubercidicus]WSX21492.1 cupin domain-containing protein [Streptomyces tubercidicus]
MSRFLRPSRRRKVGYTVMAAALCLAVGGVANATPSAAPSTPAAPATGGPITSETLSEGDTDRPFSVQADGPRHLVYRKAVIPPGTATGWHYHVGAEVAVIKSGTLTRINGADCTIRTFKPGDALVEPTGPAEVHYGVNKGTEPVVLYITDVLPAGAPFSQPAADPGCGTAK